jgi:hypothetical protein
MLIITTLNSWIIGQSPIRFDLFFTEGRTYLSPLPYRFKAHHFCNLNFKKHHTVATRQKLSFFIEIGVKKVFLYGTVPLQIANSATFYDKNARRYLPRFAYFYHKTLKRLLINKTEIINPCNGWDRPFQKTRKRYSTVYDDSFIKVRYSAARMTTIDSLLFNLNKAWHI